MVDRKATRSAYLKRYRNTPKGAAVFAWNRITSRAGAKYNHRKCYASVEVRMTREEFMAWAVPAYEEWFRDRPGVTPSVDRIDSKGHYEPGNIRLLPVQDNRRRSSKFINDFAPEGTKWCPSCTGFLPFASFYQTNRRTYHRLGLSAYCRKCANRRQKTPANNA